MLQKPSSFLRWLDLEFHFPFGWGELWGIADRGNYDLKCHSDASGKMLDMEVKKSVVIG
jgi:glycyl-tRNA synthetase (class II)